MTSTLPSLVVARPADDPSGTDSAFPDRVRTLGGPVAETGSFEGLFDCLRTGAVEACFVDALLEGLLERLPELLGRGSRPAVVLTTGPAELATAMSGFELGADDVVERSADVADLKASLTRARRRLALATEKRADTEAWRAKGEELIAGESTAARKFREEIRRVARTPDSTVLLRGEPGSDLERVARLLHDLSTRALGPPAPFVVLETAPPGPMPVVQGGTLFVRELSALDTPLQKGVLELCEARPAGNRAGFRLVVAATGDVEEALETGRLDEALFSRLNVLTLRVPALRDRSEDLPGLAASVVARATAEGTRRPHLSPEALEALERHDWPGDLRELEARLFLGLATAETETLDPVHLGHLGVTPGADSAADLVPHGRSLRVVEEAVIRRVLREERGNKSRTARVLGINRATLYNKLRAYDIA